ncbi:MAG: YqaE/Pmp3 family membrane protein [Pirellulaceae bacterium]
MLYLLAILAPPVAAAVCGSGRQLALNVLLTLLGFLPGVVHACFLVRRRNSNASSSWRGAAGAAAPEHGWQQPLAGGGRPLGRVRWLRLGLLGVLLLVLLGVLLYFLLDAPDRTPLVAISATNYEWPMTPNAWSREDLDALYDLDGQTLAIYDASEGWDAPTLGVEQFERILVSLKRRAAYDKRLIAYISMHGAVNGAGQPCLVPPGATPLNSDTWLPLTELLDVIKRQGFADDVRILLVLDCNRRLVNWNAGILYNDFADRLEDVVQHSGMKNLVVLNSTSSGQQGWASSRFQATVFGRYFRLGLAGAADRDRTSGNDDGHVSLLELVRYVESRTDAWARRYRADSLTPLLLPHDVDDFRLAQSLNEESLTAMLDQASQAEARSPPISQEKISDLWKAHDRLAADHPNRAVPIAWREYVHRLLWLEQCNTSGRAYDLRARSLLVEMERYGAEVESTLTSAGVNSRRSLSVVRDLRFEGGAQMKPHSLALAEFFGKISQADVNALGGKMDQFQQSPSAASLAAALKALDAADTRYSDARFLSLLQEAQVLSQWTDASVVGRSLGVRRQAEDLAAALQQDGAPGDLRAHVWAWPELDVADDTRRRAEDLVIAGESAAGNQPQQLYDKAAAKYQQASEKFDAAAQAFAIRDGAWARIPYLAQWLARPLPRGQSATTWDNAVNGTLLPLIAGVDELNQTLVAYDPIDDQDLRTTAPPPLAPIDQVEQLYGALEQNVNTAAQQMLASASSDAATLREIDALLELPLIPWQTRSDLSARRARIAAALAASTTEPSNTSPRRARQETAADDDPPGLLVRIESRWRVHPLLAILDPRQAFPSEETSASSLTRIDEMGDQVRHLLGSIATRVESDPQDAEWIIRSAAAVWFRPPAVDPIEVEGRRDVQRLLIWQARRALDDFLGPTSGSQTPFFAMTATDYVAMAQGVTLPTTAVAQRLDEVQALLAARKLAASQGLSVHASDILLTDPADAVSTAVAVRALPSGAGADFPQGVVSVFLADQNQRLGATHEVSLPLSSASDPSASDPTSSGDQAATAAANGASTTDGASVQFPIHLNGSQLAGHGPTLGIEGQFRGNRFASSLLLRVPGGSVVEATRPDYGPPAITLRGRQQKLVSVVVVLDCSYSMSEPVGGGAAGAANANANGPTSDTTGSGASTSGGSRGVGAGAAAARSRMEEAKLAVRGILQQLGAVENVRVGVCLFGHRVGWDTETPNLLRRQTDYGEPIPLALRPYNDIELVMPLGRFGKDQSRKLDDLLATVKPWGETPLYLSLIEAIGDFGPSDEGSQKVVLVITDGVNNQYNPPPSADKTLDDVLAARGKQDIRVDILGFGIPAQQQNQAAAAFDRLAKETGGHYAQVTRAAEMVDWLKPLFTPNPYRVDYQGEQVAQADLGTLVRLPASSAARTYTVSTDEIKQATPVEPGVSLQLVTNADDDRLQASPYLTDDPYFVRAIHGPDQQEAGYRVAAHRPTVDEQGVRFPVSVQSDRGEVMLRPDEIWVEITPRASNSDQRFDKYVLYEPWYAANASAPLLNVTASNWPKTADLAEIRVFGKSPATPPTQSVSLKDVADRPPSASTGFPIETMPSVTYQVRTRRAPASNGWEVLVVERHTSDTDELADVKVELSPPPDRVRHQFDAQNSVVLHTFTYHSATRDEIEQLQILFTSRQALAAGCWISEKPIERRVP